MFKPVLVIVVVDAQRREPVLTELLDDLEAVEQKAVAVAVLVDRPFAPEQLPVDRDVRRLPGHLIPVGLADIHIAGAKPRLAAGDGAEQAVVVIA